MRRSAVDKEIVVPDMETGKRDTRIASIQGSIRMECSLLCVITIGHVLDRLQDMFEISFKDEAIVDRGLRKQNPNDLTYKKVVNSFSMGFHRNTASIAEQK